MSDIEEALAQRKANAMPIPADLTSPSQLKWHKKCVSIGANMYEYHPCRIVSNPMYKRTRSESSSDESNDSDDEEESYIHYIGNPRKAEISKKRLIPFYGLKLSSVEDDRVWCKQTLSKFNRQKQAEIQGKINKKTLLTNLRAEMIFLDRILKAAKEIEKKKKKEDDRLDEPYTQALLNDSDEELNQYFRGYDSKKSKSEPIKPGDVLKYYSPIFVHGDARGLRKATVISVDPNRDPMVILDNGECIPSDTEVKRVKVLVDGVLKEHPGIFRSLDEFKLRKLGPLTSSAEGDHGMQKEVARVGKIIHKNMERIRDKGYSMDLINDYRGASKYGNNKEKANRDKKKTVSPKRLDRKLDTYSSLDMNTSSSENDELELRANKSKDKRKVDRDSKGIGTNEIISSNNRKNTRTGKDFINDYRGASKYGNNKENSHCEVKRKTVSPKRLERKSAAYSSFDMDTSSSENDKLELRANKSKDRKKSDRNSEGIGTSEIISSNNRKSKRAGKDFINDYRGASKYGNNKENSHCEGKRKSVSPERLDKKSATCSSFDMDTSSSENDELELRANKSKDRTKSDRDSEGIGTSEIIRSNNRKSIRAGKNIHKNTDKTRDKSHFINGDRGVSSSRNKEKSHREVKKKTVNRESAIYSSLDMGTSSSENGELELRGDKSKDRTKVDRDSEGIGTNEIISSDGECSIVNKYGYSKCREKSKSSQKVSSRKDNQCLNLYKRKEHSSIKDRIEVSSDSVTKSTSIKTDEEYCLRKPRRLSTDINSSIMNVSSHNESNNELEESNSNLEEPYTQALGIDSSDKIDISLKKETREPIRKGDVLQYYKERTKGRCKQKFISTVISVDPDRSPILVLDSGDRLSPDAKVKRVKIFIKNRLVDHPGISRSLKKFNLVKHKPLIQRNVDSAVRIQVKTKGVGNIVQNEVKTKRVRNAVQNGIHIPKGTDRAMIKATPLKIGKSVVRRSPMSLPPKKRFDSKPSLYSSCSYPFANDAKLNIYGNDLKQISRKHEPQSSIKNRSNYAKVHFRSSSQDVALENCVKSNGKKKDSFQLFSKKYYEG